MQKTTSRTMTLRQKKYIGLVIFIFGALITVGGLFLEVYHLVHSGGAAIIIGLVMTVLALVYDQYWSVPKIPTQRRSF